MPQHVCVCKRTRTPVSLCVCFHASLGVSQLKPAVYHSSLPCVTSKLHHAWLGLFMTQSQEGHMCLCWGLCYKIWTRIKNDHSPHHHYVLFSKDIMSESFSVGVLGPKGQWEYLSGYQRQMSVQACVLHASKLGKLLWKLSGHREFFVFTLGSILFAVPLGNVRTVMTWERMTWTKGGIKKTGCTTYGGQRAGAGGGCISTKSHLYHCTSLKILHLK